MLLIPVLILTGLVGLTTSQCSCDLSPLCDILCCCDTSCSQDDLLSFNCQTENKNETEKSCIPKSMMILSNLYLPYYGEIIDDLFCVIRQKERVVSESVALSESKLIRLANLLSPQAQVSKTFDPSQRYYKANDQVQLILPDNSIRYLSYPRRLLSSKIVYLPVNYMANKKSTIKYQTCTNDKFASEIAKSKILAKPDDLANCTGLESVYKECNRLISIQTDCINVDGTESSSCVVDEIIKTNSISSIRILIEFSNPEGIKSANMSLTLYDKCERDYFQSFDLIFYQSSQSSILDNLDKLKLSGNPGYIPNEPVVAGHWNSTYLNISPDRESRFTLLSRPDCTSRESIRFGQNHHSECIYSPSLTIVSEEACKKLQTDLLDILLGPEIRPNYVASFGSLIDSKNVTEWTEIKNSYPNTTEVFKEPNECNKLINGVNIVIGYAMVGNVNNPQARIVQVVYNWNKIDFKSKCETSGVDCKESIKLFSKVTHVDLSVDPYTMFARLPSTNPIVSEQFFYPFVTSAHHNHTNMSLGLLVICFFIHLIQN